MNIGIIGEGAIGRYVRDRLIEREHLIGAVLVRAERLQECAAASAGTNYVASVAELPDDIEHMIDCAGHQALAAYGPDVLRRGIHLTCRSEHWLTMLFTRASSAPRPKAMRSCISRAARSVRWIACRRRKSGRCTA